MKHLLFLLASIAFTSLLAQNEITIEQCYQSAQTNYPLAKQANLLSQKNDLEKKVLEKNRLPTFNLNAQGTYQSEVTHLPIQVPGFPIAIPNKGQYKANATVSQLIYSGGIISSSIEAKSAELLTQQKQIEVNLHQLNKQINQIYFSLLLIESKKELLISHQKQLAIKLKEVNAGIKNGVLVESATTALEIEVLKLNQMNLELNESKKSLVASLANLTGVDINENSTYINPQFNTNVLASIQRPEMELFALQKNQISSSEQLLARKNAPKLSTFATTGLGNPGLNFLDNTLQPYYMIGVKFNWNVFDWNSNKTERKSLLINKDIITTQQEAFELNTSIELQQYQTEIKKIEGLIETDKMIIELRRKVIKTTEAQLKNGEITSSAYTDELTNMFEAENNLTQHKIELEMAKANYNTTKGN